MYNVGFGDCFLLIFPAPDGRPRKVLIDCGAHFLGKNPDPPFKDVIKQLIEDVKEDGAPKIDVVIATHRHQDHVSGFADKLWDKVEVGEVWMPWTEDYENEKAREILVKQSSKAKRLQLLFQMMLKNPLRFGLEHEAQKDEVKELKEFAANSLTNTEAMDRLHNGFLKKEAAARRYLPYEDRAKNTHQSELLPGVTAYLMGPSYDKEVIRDMNPPSGEKWFRMMEDICDDDKETLLPFHADWGRKPSELSDAEQILKKSIRDDIQDIDKNTAFNVAQALEDSVNGTSLMMMFKIGKAYLFFPGDAQHGTWQSALKDPEWRELLDKTNFYKVGHHGSHNATPKEFVEKVMQPKCKAMISVFPVKKFSEIPKAEMLDKMTERKAHYVRSDIAGPDGDPVGFTRTRFYVETEIPV